MALIFQACTYTHLRSPLTIYWRFTVCDYEIIVNGTYISNLEFLYYIYLEVWCFTLQVITLQKPLHVSV